jgi:hypothetical protein
MSGKYWGKGAIELRYADCEHTIFIPRGHTADHQHCYACHPKLAKEPLAGRCEGAYLKGSIEIVRKIDARSPGDKVPGKL